MSGPFQRFGLGEDLPEHEAPDPTWKLRVELVPQTSWGNNLRSALAKKDWDRLRKRQYRLAGYKCEVCGGKGPAHPVECHEIWSYDDKSYVQTLEGLIALCPKCHEVKHFGRTEAMGRANQAMDHLMRVNQWELPVAYDHVFTAFEKWRGRSGNDWDLDLEWLRDNGVQSWTEPGAQENPW